MSAQRLALQLWPRVAHVLQHVPQNEWPRVAALLQPFIAAPSPASFLGAARSLATMLRLSALAQGVKSRWQAELDAVREALAGDSRFAPLAIGEARDGRAGERLAALAMILSLRELAEAKGEAAAEKVKQRLRDEQAALKKRLRQQPGK